MVQAPSQKSMELEGNLKTFALPDLLRILSVGHMTGVLEVAHGGRVVEVAIKEGRIIGAASPARFCRLGELLVSNGHISRHDLEDVLQSQRENKNGRLLGELLIERKLVTSEQVQALLGLQVREELYELFTWGEGAFKFEHGATSVMDHVLMTIDIEELIVEGARCAEQYRAIARSLSNMAQVYRVRADITALPDKRLDVKSWKVLSFINARNSIQALIHLSGLGKFETLVAVDRLLSLELIESVQHRTTRVARGGGALKITEAPFEAPRKPTDTPSETGGAENGGGLRGLFGKRSKKVLEPAAAPARPALEERLLPEASYPTHAALACDLVNKLLERLEGESDFKTAYLGEEGLERLWNEQLMRFPRADLVIVRGDRLEATRFNRSIAVAGAGSGAEAYAGIAEDTLGALAALGRTLRALALNTLGERAAGIIGDVAQPFMQRAAAAWPADFKARTWAGQWVE